MQIQLAGVYVYIVLLVYMCTYRAILLADAAEAREDEGCSARLRARNFGEEQPHEHCVDENGNQALHDQDGWIRLSDRGVQVDADKKANVPVRSPDRDPRLHTRTHVGTIHMLSTSVASSGDCTRMSEKEHWTTDSMDAG
jgi:hypothetical protein